MGVTYPLGRIGDERGRPCFVAEPPPDARPRLLDQVRDAIRVRHLSPRTEEAYVHWIKRYILFHHKRHPQEMGEKEVADFLSALAVQGNVSASTQNQALNALLFRYREVLKVELGWLEDVVRAKKPRRLRVVLTREEVAQVLGALNGPPRLMATLLYGAGLRLMECCRLRIKDIDFGARHIVVRAGKGNKDRITLLPRAIQPELRPTSRPSVASTRPTSPTTPAGSSFPTRWAASTPTPDVSGRGNGSSPPPGPTSIGRPASSAATTSTSP